MNNLQENASRREARSAHITEAAFDGSAVSVIYVHPKVIITSPPSDQEPFKNYQ